MANTVSRTISDATLSRIIQIESGGRPNIRASSSSATGLGQFIDGTWRTIVKRHRPDLMKGRTDRQVLELRKDPSIMIEMLARFTEENARALGSGYQDGDLYLAHFLGVGTAKKFLRANPSAAASLAGQAAVNANPSILRGKTVGQVRAWAARKMAAAGKVNWVARYYVGKPQSVAAVDDEIDDEVKGTAVEEFSSSDRTEEVEVPHGESGAKYSDVQKRLKALGYHEVGMIDGKWGGRTAAAIAAFKNDRHLTGEALIDDDLMAELTKAEGEGWKRPIAKERSEMSDEDIREVAPAAKASWRNKIAAWFAGIGTSIAAIFTKLSESFDDVSNSQWFTHIKDLAGSIPTSLWIAGALAFCGFVFWNSRWVEKETQENVREGKLP